jgi:hypothetical protein
MPYRAWSTGSLGSQVVDMGGWGGGVGVKDRDTEIDS